MEKQKNQENKKKTNKQRNKETQQSKEWKPNMIDEKNKGWWN
jgi:hypothetical protein